MKDFANKNWLKDVQSFEGFSKTLDCVCWGIILIGLIYFGQGIFEFFGIFKLRY